MSKKILTIVILSIHVLSYSQKGASYLFNHNFQNLGIDPVNFKAIQGNDGVMYFANSKGVLKYDGYKWTLIKTDWTPRTIAIDKDSENKIFIGCINNFGYIRNNRYGQSEYISISEKLDSVGYIDEIYVMENEIYFCSSNLIVSVSKNDYTINNRWIAKKNQTFNGFFTLHDELYVNFNHSGIHKLDHNDFHALPKGSMFADFTIISSCNPENSKVLIATNNSIIFTYDGKNFNEYNYDSKDYVTGNILSSIEKLKNNDIVVSTLSGGCVIIDYNTGKKKSLINYQSGLPDDEITATCSDKYGGLWICHAYGVSRADIYLPIENFSVFLGIEGTLLSVNILNDVIYVSTNEGVFFLTEVKKVEEVDHLIRKENRKTTSTRTFRTIKTISKALKLTFIDENGEPVVKEIPFSVEVPMDSVATSTVQEFTNKRVRKLYVLESIPYIFKRVKGVEGKCQQLITFKNKLLVASNLGLFQIEGTTATRIIKDIYINYIQRSESDPDKIYIGSNKGLKILNYSNNEWNIVKELNPDINIFSVDENKNRIWYSSNNVVYKTYKNGTNPVGYTVFDDISENIIIRNIKGDILFFSYKGIYKYNEEKDEIIFSKNYEKDFNTGNIIYNQPGYTWIKKNQAWQNIDDLYNADHDKSILLSMLNNIKEVYADNHQNLWVISDDKLYKIKDNILGTYAEQYKISVNRIKDKHEKVLPVKENIKLKYSNNAIHVKVSSLFYLNEESFKYSYRIKGIDNNWSPWAPDPVISYPYLPGGNFTLEIKALNVFGKESEITKVQINVESPFWQSLWFYLVVILVIIAVIYIYIKIRTQKLEKANKILEEKINEATAEIRKQKDELEVAYKDIEEKNISITGSINYAQKIQEAILPLEDTIQDSFDDSFVLFKPRDIVSGDFYWFHDLDDRKIIIASDCTGHGVPGAFMSMIGNTLLNQIIKEKRITQPAQILNNLDKEIVKVLKQELSPESLHDGMDITICCIHKNKNLLEFAGAKNPLLIIRNNEVERIKSDRFAIGGLTKTGEKKFTNHEIEINELSMCYIFSDGYSDQGGGDDQSKFSSKKFKELLLNIHQKDFKSQKMILNEEFEKWKGKFSQRDDVLVIGFKINPK